MEVLYQTVQRPEAWVAVLALLCQHLGADSGMIRFYARGWSAVDLTLTHGFDPSFTAAYREHFVHLDPIPGTIERAMLPPGVRLCWTHSSRTASSSARSSTATTCSRRTSVT